ncbi:hypothetical protein [Stenotrophomonas maltophilia]|uniref:hypothetical protein n=1 Tax=Stenotrophomonas maltophilia TaxID=40324 RepID=UPI002E763564|nr:hypothetical protein [Stenotrophomonas maltophilia]
MDSIEKRARERVKFDAWVKAAGCYGWHGFNRLEDMWDAWQAALTQAEGYVAAPEDPSLAMTAGGQLFGLTASQACAVYQSMLAARPEVKP